MGVDRAHVSSMERGLQNVTLLTVWEASQAVGRKPADLLDEGGVAVDAPDPLARSPRRRRTKR